ncbi:MAG: GNAT family N-acetyltransferase [Planctomycetota bacterium]|jgi:ribosomal-protein-alanine N-acetyltransferase
MNVVIEKAKEEDKPFIFELLQQANMHHIPSEEMPGLTYENYFVAKAEDKVVGFCGCKILSATKAKTELMVVNREYRGKGIGYKLQVRRMEDMRKKGIQLLTTNADLPATIEWYKKHFGYREIGRLKKLHEFGNPDIDCWTTLEVDLCRWASNREKER